MSTQIITKRASGAARGPNEQASKGRLTRIRVEGAEPNRKKNRGGSVLGTSKELLGRPPVPGSPELLSASQESSALDLQPTWLTVYRQSQGRAGNRLRWDENPGLWTPSPQFSPLHLICAYTFCCPSTCKDKSPRNGRALQETMVWQMAEPQQMKPRLCVQSPSGPGHGGPCPQTYLLELFHCPATKSKWPPRNEWGSGHWMNINAPQYSTYPTPESLHEWKIIVSDHVLLEVREWIFFNLNRTQYSD